MRRYESEMRQRGQALMGSLGERCNEFLVQRGQAGRDALCELEAAGRRDERLHTFLKSPLLARPGLLEAYELDPLVRDLSTLLELLTTLPTRLFEGDCATMCQRVGIIGPGRRAVLETVDESSVLLARADVIRSASEPKAIEFNVHSSLGGMDIGPLNETFLELPVYRDFLAAEELSYCDPLDSIVSELQQAAMAKGMTGTPTLALVDWPSSYPKYEQVLERVCAMFRARGFDALQTHVGTLQRRDDHLWHGGRRIDILYRIFMLEDIPEQPELIEPILDVHRSGNVLLAMSFVAELVGNKATLALLSEPTEPDFLTPSERDAVRRILPETRLLRRGATSWHGERCELIDLAIANREKLVLKPAIGHGTLGVVAGWAVTEEEWRRALARCEGGTFVLQERVKAAPEILPVLNGDDWEMHAYDVNWGIFIHRERYAGGMLRALPSNRPSVISLGAGGSLGCCFHEEGPPHGGR